MTDVNKVSLESLTEDYPTEPVPAGISVGGWRIAMVNTALAFSIPGLLTGAWVGTSLGLKDSLVAFVLAGIILSAIGYVTGVVGVRKRLSSYMLIQSAFGTWGSKAINLLIAVSLFGWFGVNVDMFASAGVGAVESAMGVTLPAPLFIALGGVLMVLAAFFGFKLIQRLAAWLVPVQILMFAILVYLTLSGTSWSELMAIPGAGDMTIGQGVSAVVGSFILSGILMPDFCRYGRTKTDAAVSSVVPFLFASTLVYLVSAMAGLYVGSSEVLDVMLGAGLGFYAFILIIVSGTITNAVNLYGCSLSLTVVFSGAREWAMVVLSGVLGTLAAYAGIQDSFIDFLIFLGIVFNPVASIYAINCFMLKLPEEGKHMQTSPYVKSALAAWVIGMVTAYLTEYAGFTLSQVSSLDALLVSGLVYLVLVKLQQTRTEPELKSSVSSSK